jgi:hypothetical protein
MPEAARSRTTLETVERERPVQRAISARLMAPFSRKAASTFPRFEARSDP